MVKKIKKRGTQIKTPISQLDSATVRVGVTRNDGSQIFGTGFIVADGNYALTAAHVIEDAKHITVSKPSGESAECEILVGKQGIVKEELQKEIPVWEIDVGLVYLRTRISDAVPIKIESDVAKTGEEVLLFGYPGGGIELEIEEKSYNPIPIATKGIIAGLTRVSYGGDISEYYIWIDRPSFPGSSGSPVFRLHTGKITGIISATPYMPKTIRIGDNQIDVEIPDGFSVAFGLNMTSKLLNNLISK